MFTGLVRDIGKIIKKESLAARDANHFEGSSTNRGEQTLPNATSSGWEYHIATNLPLADLAVGNSIACNGVCLTIVTCSQIDNVTEATFASVFSVHVGPVTLEKTLLDKWSVGDLINLEPALAYGTPVGGHLVQGHVDGILPVLSCHRREDGFTILSLGLPPMHHEAVIPQGSIAVRGVSLTVASLAEDCSHLTIMLIPHTLSVTNLKNIQGGDFVEVEFDLQIKVISANLKRILPSFLKRISP